MDDLPHGRSATGALAALSLAILLPSLATSIANVALPAVAEAFEAPFGQVQWVLLSYLVAVTALVVGAGRLGDLLGRRRLLLGGTALFTVASLLCAAAPSLHWLIAARAAQGLGAAAMLALALALAGDSLPRERSAQATGLLGTMSAAGTALGPSLGGLLIAGAGWPAVFLVNLPLGLLAFLLALRHLPADSPAPRWEGGGFDLLGTGLLAASLAAYALALTAGREDLGPLGWALPAAAALGAGLFARVEARAKWPLIRPGLLRDRRLGPALAASAIVATVIMATLVVGPFYLSRGLGLGPALAGLALSLGPAVAALAGVPAGRLAGRIGTRRSALLGLCAMAAGCLVLALAPPVFGLLAYLGPVAVVTGGYALFQTANNGAVMAEAAPDERGLVSGLLTLSRNLGLVTGASAMGALFAAASGSADVAVASPAAVAAGMRVTFAVATVALLAAMTLVAAAAGTQAPRQKPRSKLLRSL